MAFDLNLWRERLGQRLAGWKARWVTLRNTGADRLYPFLAAAALWPVVEAVRQGEWAALAVLGGVTAGLGSNLLANTLQSWKDEADAARQLAAAVERDAGLRAELDAVLDALDVLARARDDLAPDDRTWFEQTLRDELAQLGNLARHQVFFAGPGAVVAHGEGATAVGPRGVSAAQVGGHVITGDHVTINELPPEMRELFARQFGFDPAASDAEALQAYFNHVILERHSKLSFLFIRPETGKVYTEGDVDVETVFVPLRLTNPEAATQRDREVFKRLEKEAEEAARPLTLPQVLKKYPCLLLRGKPGCGKTTLLRHIALAFARGQQGEKLGWQGPVPLPLLVSLRNLGAFLRSKTRDGHYIEPQPAALLAYLEDHLRGAGVPFSPGFMPQRLERGECLLLLDALDEASGELDGGGDLRTAVARQVAAFIRHYGPRGNRFVLTSRPRAYQDEGAMRRALSQPTVCDVLDLDATGYGHLITNLLTVLTGDAATGQAEAADLVGRIAPNRQLADLAGNPLLCTTLVLVYKYRGRKLPERRVDVLHEIVTLLLGRWYEERTQVYNPEGLVLEATPARTAEQAIQFRRRALVALAWQMQQAATAEISTAGATATLAQFYCDEERTDALTAEKWAHGFLEVAHERSGLFITIDASLHTFAHQAFREYLAATYLVNAGEARLLDEVWRHAPIPDEWWEQVILFAGAHPELGSGAAGRLIEKLLQPGLPAQAGDLACAHLAARCAQDMTDKLPGPQRKHLQDWLAGVLGDEARPAKERTAAGRSLALAGDPRPGVGVIPSPVSRGRAGEGVLPDILWCKVPAGPFLMGSADEDEMSHSNEKPQHEQTIPAPYGIGKYPVTVAQYACFVQAGGYGERRFWTAAGWAWREGKGAGPKDYGERYNLANHPAAGVSWYETVAFCRWLTEALREAGELSEGQTVMLPSEAEWEKAARGGLERARHAVPLRTNPNPGRVFPWGDTPDPNRANYDATGIGATSAVGCFPGGKSPYGVEELSGNVWEWTRSVWGKDLEKPDFEYPYKAEDGREELDDNNPRVMRGGSFDYDRSGARCASRLRHFPNLVWYNLGFRVVVSPISPTSAL
ncbi:MAG: SUMF1/EgtB/PvdO family nonheme iron enzyme [Chloroflexota bacterium]